MVKVEQTPPVGKARSTTRNNAAVTERGPQGTGRPGGHSRDTERGGPCGTPRHGGPCHGNEAEGRGAAHKPRSNYTPQGPIF